MKIELEIGTHELGHDIFEQIFVQKLQDIMRMCSKTCWNHPDDRKMDKKIVKACEVLLKYYGELDEPANT